MSAHSHNSHQHHATPDHSHDADHGGFHHAHLPSTTRAFAWGVGLNMAFVIAELGLGLWTNSLALIADAGHNFGDVIGLALAWSALKLAQRKPTHKFTYGLGSSTILAALANAMLLLVATGTILLEAFQRLGHPEPVNSKVVIVVALIGVAINGISAYLFMRDQAHDLNVRGAYLHLMGDAAVSLGVAFAGALMLFGVGPWVDPVTSIVIAVVIVATTWGLLKESVRMSLHAVPAQIDSREVKRYLESLEGVSEVHDLHIWPISTTQTALTAHLVMPNGTPADDFYARVADELLDQFRIGHPTLQVERGTAGACASACDGASVTAEGTAPQTSHGHQGPAH